MHEITTTRANPMVDPSVHVWHAEVPIYLFLGGLVAGLMVLTGIWQLRRGRDASRALALIAEEVTLADNLGWDVAEDRVVLPKSLRGPDTGGPANRDLAVPSARHPRWFWTWPFTYLLKMPAGCLYARHERLGYLLLGTGLAGLVMFALTGSQSALLVWAAAILLDLCAAPVLTAIAKRRSAR